VIVLGVDVGKTSGVCLLDCSGSKPRLLDRCDVEDDLAGVLDVRFFGLHTIDVVGIETPTQVFEHGRAKKSPGARRGIEKALLAATPMVGVVRTVARLRAPSAVIYEGQAHEVRRAILGRLPKDHLDRFIGAMVPRLIDGWPERSNDHVRDAAVVALYSWRRSRMPRPIVPQKAQKRAKRAP
jgi:hypothetical protein